MLTAAYCRGALTAACCDGMPAERDCGGAALDGGIAPTEQYCDGAFAGTYADGTITS